MYVKRASFWTIGSISRPKIESNIVFKRIKCFCKSFIRFLGHSKAYKNLPTPPNHFKWNKKKEILNYKNMVGFLAIGGLSRAKIERNLNPLLN